MSQNIAFQCTVCLEDDLSEQKRAVMPCCGRGPTAHMQFCRECIWTICGRSHSEIGRCPGCRSFLRFKKNEIQGESFQDDFGTIEAVSAAGRCSFCHQIRVILDRQATETGILELCDACSFGQRHILRYECQRCGGIQRIPHPMWRYQESPTVFGNVTWVCHGRCKDFTTWRVFSDDGASVPVQDAPASWGRQEQWLVQVREERLRWRKKTEARQWKYAAFWAAGMGISVLAHRFFGTSDMALSDWFAFVCLAVSVYFTVSTTMTEPHPNVARL